LLIKELCSFASVGIHTGIQETEMNDEFKKGDKVAWRFSHRIIRGTVKEKLTAPTDVRGYQVAASPDHPEYLVVNDKTGTEAVHKPRALKRR
jgi:hypothetical protein